MSLINDALRRARKANPAGTSRAATPPLRPVEPPGRRSIFSPPFLGAVVLLLVGIALWSWSRAGKYSDLKVRANGRPPAESSASIPEPPVTPPLSDPVVVAAAAPAVAPTNLLSTNATAVSSNEPVTTAEVPKPEPARYKLQGIFYKPGNPSAAINGKTVFVGSHVGDARVTAITTESVTIVTDAGETKVLEVGD